MAMIIPPKKPIQNQTDELISYGQTVNQQTDDILNHLGKKPAEVIDIGDSIIDIETQERIKDNESIGGKPEYMPYQLEYKDKKENFYTVGHGHRLYGIENNPNEINRVYSDKEIENFFKQDLKIAANHVDRLVDKNKIDPKAYGILVEMAYQMGSNIEEGTGLAGFTQTLQHINSGRYDLASKEMLKSKWHNQTPDRAERLSDLMANINGKRT